MSSKPAAVQAAPPVLIPVVMNADDFERLAHTSMEWASNTGDWQDLVNHGQFEGDPAPHWKWAHFVGPGYAAVVLARSFLLGHGYDCQIVWRMADDPNWVGWVVLTDYGT